MRKSSHGGCVASATHSGGPIFDSVTSARLHACRRVLWRVDFRVMKAAVLTRQGWIASRFVRPEEISQAVLDSGCTEQLFPKE